MTLHLTMLLFEGPEQPLAESCELVFSAKSLNKYLIVQSLSDDDEVCL
jgi:hypothetical protein